jgi:hypothetical protein
MGASGLRAKSDYLEVVGGVRGFPPKAFPSVKDMTAGAEAPFIQLLYRHD